MEPRLDELHRSWTFKLEIRDRDGDILVWFSWDFMELYIKLANVEDGPQIVRRIWA
jgi:hypothetical protein